MTTSPVEPPSTAPVDEDLADQARPGHGIPSQDPDPAAQSELEPEAARREAEQAMAGGGAVGGAALGATIGVVVAGPLGVLVGGTVGALAGAAGGAAAGTALSPVEPDVAAAADDTKRPPRGGAVADGD